MRVEDQKPARGEEWTSIRATVAVRSMKKSSRVGVRGLRNRLELRARKDVAVA
jgi:hypothetical protein